MFCRNCSSSVVSFLKTVGSTTKQCGWAEAETIVSNSLAVSFCFSMIFTNIFIEDRFEPWGLRLDIEKLEDDLSTFD